MGDEVEVDFMLDDLTLNVINGRFDIYELVVPLL